MIRTAIRVVQYIIFSNQLIILENKFTDVTFAYNNKLSILC